MDIKINKLQKILNIKFNNINTLIQAITHKSYNSKINYEKLEFLGDRVLGLIISNRLLELYPHEKVGILDKKFSNLVNKNICYEIGIKLKLNEFVLVGNTKKKDVKIENKIISDVCESIIGAIYLDRGYKTCRKFVLEKVIIDYVDVDRLIEEETDFKSKLVEWVQKNKAAYEYKITEVNRGKYNTFRCELYINNKKRSTTEERSKKRAEQEAAKDFFHQLSVE